MIRKSFPFFVKFPPPKIFSSDPGFSEPRMWGKSVTSIERAKTFMGPFGSPTLQSLHGIRRESGTLAKNAKNRCQKFIPQESVGGLKQTQSSLRRNNL
jgi:hypothetical protein